MKHLHKCGKHLIRLESIHVIGDIDEGWEPSPGRDGVPYGKIPSFPVSIGNEFGLGVLNVEYHEKSKLEDMKNDLVKAWEEFLDKKSLTDRG